MKTFAFLPQIPGPAREIFKGAELFEMHPDSALFWVEAPEGAQVGDVFDGTTWAQVSDTLTRAQDWGKRCREALTALARTAASIERIMEAVSLGTTVLGADDVQKFMQYRRDLRAFPHLDVSDESKPLPVVPAHPGYPAGT